MYVLRTYLDLTVSSSDLQVGDTCPPSPGGLPGTLLAHDDAIAEELRVDLDAGCLENEYLSCFVFVFVFVFVVVVVSFVSGCLLCTALV